MIATLPIILVCAFQGVDIALHVATGQFEVIRLASNIIAVFGAMAVHVASKRALSAVLVSGAGYILFNAVFLAQNGLTNPSTGNLRLPLFAFVFITLFLYFWSWRRTQFADKLQR